MIESTFLTSLIYIKTKNMGLYDIQPAYTLHNYLLLDCYQSSRNQ